MGLLEFVSCLFASLFTVTLRRLRSGPLFPTWSWRYEVITTAQKSFHRRVARRAPAEERRAWEALKARGSGFKQTEQTEAKLGPVRARWYAARSHGQFRKAVLYLHGGGFMYGSENSHGEICARIALAANARVALIDYRLAPEHPFPSALDDAIGAYLALLDGGTPSTEVVLAGDSAGGNLALSLMLALKERALPLPAGAVVISPWVDTAARGGSMVENERYEWADRWMFDRWENCYVGSASRADPLVSPGLGNLEGLPPLFVTVGTAEMLHDQVVALVERAVASGVSVTFEPAEGRVHMWISLADVIPEFNDTFDHIGHFVEKVAVGRHDSTEGDSAASG